MKNKVLGIFLIALMVMPAVITPNTSPLSQVVNKSEKMIQLETVRGSETGKIKLKPINQELLENAPKQSLSEVETIRISGVTWTKPPGDWWDTDWEYRINVTVTEPGVVDRKDWPVDVYLTFDPPAYKYSIRVIYFDGYDFNEVPSQVWNVTYCNSTHLSAATVTFLADLNKGESKVYQIYWSIDETDPPTYPKRINFYEQEGVYYIYSPKGWYLTLPTSNGGKASTFYFNGTDLEHQSSTISNEITHFGVTLDPALKYEKYWGNYTTNNENYIRRDILEIRDPLEQIYAGVIFVTYVVEKVPLQSNTGVSIGNVSYYYRFLDWGVIVYEEVEFGSTINNGSVYLGGWIFDQDNGDAGSTFATIYPPETLLPEESWDFILYDEFTTIDTNTWYTRSNVVGYPTSDGDFLILTPPDNNIYGQAWLKWEVTSDFIAEFSFWIGGGRGADGIVFMFYKSRDYSPDTGGSLGFTGSGTYYGFGVEIDTWKNSFDPDDSHIALIKDDVSNHLAIYTLPTKTELREQLHTLRIKVSGDNILIWYDGTLAINYTDPALLNRTYGWMGFSAATGGATDYHKIGYFKLWVLNPGCEGEDIYFEKSYANGEYIGIFNNDTRVGVGFIYEQLKFIGAEGIPVITVYNEGNQTNDGLQDTEDYIYSVVNLTRVNASSGDKITLRYILFPWNASNSISASEVIFDTWVNMFKNPLVTSLNMTERFKIRVKVKVIDYEGGPIPGANVTLTNDTLKYSGFTDNNGEIVFDVYRVRYQFIITLSNNINATYVNDTVSIAYNDTTTWHYYNLTDEVIIKFKDVYKVTVLAYAADNETILQNGLVQLNDTAHVYRGYTNSSGELTFYIKGGKWTLMFNHTSTDEVWDYYNLTLVGAGQIATEVQAFDLTISSNMILRLIDINATKPPEITRLELYETSSTYEKYWNESVTIKVRFYRTLNNELIDGNITWYIVDSANVLFLAGSVDTVNGEAVITINTADLLADKSYVIIINSSEIYTTPPTQGFALPSPLNVFLRVKPRPISMDVTFNPSATVYYLESISIEVVLRDYFTSNRISHAEVNLTISGISGVTELTETSPGVYKASLPQLDAGLYTITITATKGNYTTVIDEHLVRIMERPTSISAPLSVEIPWSETYSFGVDYIDTRLNTHISSAYATYRILNARTGEVVIHETQISEKNGYYLININIESYNLIEGDYLIEINFGKKNYLNQTAIIPFTIRLRQTTLDKETSTIKVYYSENFTVRVYFRDLDAGGSPIAGAMCKYSINDFETGETIIQGDLRDLGNGTFYLEFNTSVLQVKNYYITITIYKEHYSSGSVTINLIIEPIPTVAYISKVSDSIEWGLYSVFIITYNDSRTNKGVNADKAVFEITNGSEWSSGEIPLEIIATGVYKLNISTLYYHLSPGVYKITIALEKLYYENKTIVVTLTVTKIRTYAYAQPANITLYWGEKTEARAYYIRSRDSAFLETTPSLTILDTTNNTQVSAGVTIILEAEYYRILVDATKLSDGHIYAVTIIFQKAYHETATITMYIRVLSIPVTLSVVPPIADIIWGNDYNFTITLINALNQSGLEGLTPTLLVYVGGERVDVRTAITWLEIGNGVYVILVKSGLLNTTAYNIYVAFTKPHYAIPSANVTARVKPVSVSVSVRTIKDVRKNPVTGTAATTVKITLRESTTGAPISGATVYVLIMRGEEEIIRVQAQEFTEEPGVYIAYIDWSKVEPGDYTIKVLIETIQRKGYIGSAETTVTIAEGVTETGVRVDYLGGSTVIAGRRYPNLVIYPIFLAIFAAIGFAGYWYYSWIRLPIEVREVIRLMKAIKKGKYEYPAPTREEAVREVLAEYLGIGK